MQFLFAPSVVKCKQAQFVWAPYQVRGGVAALYTSVSVLICQQQYCVLRVEVGVAVRVACCCCCYRQRPLMGQPGTLE